jgi:hypothetical protein
MELRNQYKEIDSASLCSLPGRCDKLGCRTGPPGWESIPMLLKMFTNTGSLPTSIVNPQSTVDRVLGYFSSRPNWPPPKRPQTQASVTAAFGSEEGWGSQFGRGDRHCGTLGYICTYFVCKPIQTNILLCLLIFMRCFLHRRRKPYYLTLTGTVSRDFYLRFFMKYFPPGPDYPRIATSICLESLRRH